MTLKTYEETVLWAAVYSATVGALRERLVEDQRYDEEWLRWMCRNEADATVEELRKRLTQEGGGNEDVRDVALLKAQVHVKEKERQAMERALSEAKADALIVRYALQDGNAGLATNEQGRDARHALARLTGFEVTFAGLLLDLEMFADESKDGEA